MKSTKLFGHKFDLKIFAANEDHDLLILYQKMWEKFLNIYGHAKIALLYIATAVSLDACGDDKQSNPCYKYIAISKYKLYQIVGKTIGIQFDLCVVNINLTITILATLICENY